MGASSPPWRQPLARRPGGPNRALGVLVGLVLLLAVSARGSGEAPAGTAARRRLWEAERLARSGRGDDARRAAALFEEVAPAFARDVSFWYNYGLTLSGLERFEDALGRFRQAARLAAAAVPGLPPRRQAALARNRGLSALRACAAVRDALLGEGVAKNMVSLVHEVQRSTVTRIAHLRDLAEEAAGALAPLAAAAAADTEPSLLHDAGVAYLLAGRAGDALPLLRRAVELDQGHTRPSWLVHLLVALAAAPSAGGAAECAVIDTAMPRQTEECDALGAVAAMTRRLLHEPALADHLARRAAPASFATEAGLAIVAEPGLARAAALLLLRGLGDAGADEGASVPLPAVVYELGRALREGWPDPESSAALDAAHAIEQRLVEDGTWASALQRPGVPLLVNGAIPWSAPFPLANAARRREAVAALGAPAVGAVERALALLEQAIPSIRAEVTASLGLVGNFTVVSDEDAQAGSTEALIQDSLGVVSRGAWHQLALMRAGVVLPEAVARLPKTTTAVLRALGAAWPRGSAAAIAAANATDAGSTSSDALVAGLQRYVDAWGVPLGAIEVSVLRPGTVLRPHCAPSNNRWRAHVPIRLPPDLPLPPHRPDECCVAGLAGGCRLEASAPLSQPALWLEAAGERRRWCADSVLLLDDSFEHHVEYTADAGAGPRVVLLVDFWHPAWMAEEAGLARETARQRLERFADAPHVRRRV